MKEISLNSEVLSNLIKFSGYTCKELAHKLNISEDRLNEGKLTLRQLKNLARILKRPLVAFFSDEILSVMLPTDFRLNREKRIGPEFYIAHRKLEYLIARLKELTSLKTKIPPFSSSLKAEELAKQFRDFLKAELYKNKRPTEILERYKKVLEEKLNLVIIELPLSTVGARGDPISDDLRAFSLFGEISGIVLNERDYPTVKLFSLFHEICHLLNKTSSLCSISYESENDLEESYCNKFAAEFLVPSYDLDGEIEKYKHSNFINLEIIGSLSKIYGISKQVTLLRLLFNNFINRDQYRILKEELENKNFPFENIQNIKIRKNWEKVFKNRVGNFALSILKNSLEDKKISFTEAIRILDIKVKYANKFFYGIS